MKDIKQEDMDLLTGYVRIKVSHDLNVPRGIIQICLIYYLIFEQWDENNKGDDIKIINSSKTIFECMAQKYQKFVPKDYIIGH